MFTLEKKHKRVLFLFIRIIISCITFVYLYQVITAEEFTNISKTMSLRDTEKLALIGFAFLLMPFNWGFDALKWKYLLKHIQEISLGTALKAIFSGVTVSLFMPNRSGEFIGRIFFIPYKKRIKAIIATIVGSYAQLTVTIFLGSVVFFFFVNNFIDEYFYIVITRFFIVALNIIMILCYFNLPLVYRLVPKRYKYNKVKAYLKVLDEIPFSELTLVLLLSFGRYFIFSSQYFLLLKAFNVDLSMIEVFKNIPLIFFVQSVIPSMALLELGIRGAAAVHFLSPYTSNHLGILSGAYSLWIVNLVIPAAIGAIILLVSRVFTPKE